MIAHDIKGTTYYQCEECGACPCPDHGSDHTRTCGHRVPDEWLDEDCANHGAGRFVICSICPRPPCQRLRIV